MLQYKHLVEEVIKSGANPAVASRIDSVLLEEQLKQVDQTLYEVKKTPNVFRQLLPIIPLNAGAATHSYQTMDTHGEAKIIHPGSTDLPDVTVDGTEVVDTIRSLGAKYSYSIQELRAAAMAGSQGLDVLRARAARRVVERKFDSWAAVGDTSVAATGLANDATVIANFLETRVYGGWGVAATTSAEVIADLIALANAITTNSSNNWVCTDIVLPAALYSPLQNPMSVDNPVPIINFFERTYGVRVTRWDRLALADAEGDGPRAIAFARDPEVLGLPIAVDFEEMPPQAQSLAFDVPCHARVAPLAIRYPIGVAYMDALADAQS